jgi:hypothetical protein
MDDEDRQARVALYDTLTEQRLELTRQVRAVVAQMWATDITRCWDCNAVCDDRGMPEDGILHHRAAVHDVEPFDFDAAIKEMDAP